MTCDPHHPLRKSIRLSAPSYKQRCAYFVTVCTHEKQCLLSEVEGQSIHLTKFGEVVRAVWLDLPNRFAGLALDEYILMPNHIHGVLCFVGAGLARPSSASTPELLASLGGAEQAPPLQTGGGSNSRSNSSLDYSLPDVMRVFKSISTVEVNRAFRRSGRPLWQRSYFDHIIRDSEGMRNHQRYILENPMRWAAKQSPSSSETPPK